MRDVNDVGAFHTQLERAIEKRVEEQEIDQWQLLGYSAHLLQASSSCGSDSTVPHIELYSLRKLEGRGCISESEYTRWCKVLRKT